MSLVFKEIIITDIKNRLSKKISFSPDMNLITSDKNSKGKSIIMKSLYHAMGANSMFDDNFKKDQMLFDIYFSFNKNNYEILRLKNDYVIIKNDKLYDSVKYGQVYKLSKFYKEELDMFVYLKDKHESIILAPPAYLFIPYYLDQDVSWKKEQEPFENMGQFEKLSRNQLYYYHLGIYSNEYFEINSKLKNNNEILNKYKNELKNKDIIFSELKKELSDKVVLNLNELDIELRNLKYILTDKSGKIEKLKSKIYEKENEIISLEFLLDNIDSAIKQISKQQNKLSSKHVVCPNCKYEYDINLKEEVENLYNNEFLLDRKEKTVIDIESLKSDVEILKKDLDIYLNEIKEVKENLFKKEINYRDYLNREAIQGLLNVKAKEISELEEKYEKQRMTCISLQMKLDSLDEKQIKVGPLFRQFYVSNLIDLGVKSFNEKKIKPFFKLSISGSLYVRSTLAFFYAFLDTKLKLNSKKFVCPLVIDSPRDGEQDDINSTLILEYILSRHVENYQLIVASVDAEKFINDEFIENNDLSIIRIMGEQNKLLTDDEYYNNKKEIEKGLSYFIF